MIERKGLVSDICDALRRSPVVVLVGPRQCGKTTLAREFVEPSSLNYLDLEDPATLGRLDEPVTEIEQLEGLVVLDEIQRRPELFPYMRYLVDRRPLPARFLVLGSASPALLRQTSESLAGRIEIIEMAGFTVEDVGEGLKDDLWLRGGLPLSFTSSSDDDSFIWRKNYVRAFIERELSDAGFTIPAQHVMRFLSMIAHTHGGLWKTSEIAVSMMLDPKTIRKYLDILSGLFFVRQLQPWFENLQKRQVKMPKVYIRDSGLLHELLGVKGFQDLVSHPKVGMSWEGFVIEEALATVKPDEQYFWATHQGAELDLLMLKDGKRLGLEVKRVDAPRLTNSMRIAGSDLRLDEFYVVYPGAKPYELAGGVKVIPFAQMHEVLGKKRR